mmetsp:Transcript_59754/g.187515  ORF Transcript_59754/g.187515 Transcript_59754/m.187515 type:complete len:253 (-) Transcript_59754:67-825(-)
MAAAAEPTAWTRSVYSPRYEAASPRYGAPYADSWQRRGEERAPRSCRSVSPRYEATLCQSRSSTSPRYEMTRQDPVIRPQRSASPRGQVSPWQRRRMRPRLPYRARLEAEQEIEDAFCTLDVDGTGEIGYRELKAAMRALGFPVKKDEVLADMREHNCLESGRVGFRSFSKILMERFEQQDPLDAMLKSFRLFDEEGRGCITLRDLRRVSQELGEGLSDGELRSMVEQFDRNHDGEIDEEEFVRVMAATSLR